jgi:xanthine dehydrogenase accessory factor
VKPEVLRLAADLSERGEPFVLATVVWRRAPSSGKEGATALITADRRVRGWLGGACAEPTVVREAEGPRGRLAAFLSSVAGEPGPGA